MNQHNIRKNLKEGNEDLPVLSVKVGKQNLKGYEVKVAGPSVVVYRPEKPMSCGAKVWIETDSHLFLRTGELDWEEIL